VRLGLYGVPAGEGAGRETLAAGLASALAAAGAVVIELGERARGKAGTSCDAVIVVGDDGQTVDGADGGAGSRWSIDAFARAGGPVLAIGAGVRVLCRLGQLPGQVNESAREDGASGPVVSHVRVEGRATPFTSAIPAGRVLRWTPAVAAARAAAAPATLEWQLPDLAALSTRGQVIFRACDAAGGTRRHSSIAGVSNQRGNVLGLLAPVEIVAGDGEQLLRSLRLHLRASR